MGNGFPIAAIAGKEDVMMTVEPGSVAQGGTYAGNSIGTAAAAATLKILEEEPVIETINKRGDLLMKGIGEILSRKGIPHVVTGVPSMFSLLLGIDKEPYEFRDYLKGDAELYEEIGMELGLNGVLPDSDGREPWFLCYSLSEADVEETLDIFERSVNKVVK